MRGVTLTQEASRRRTREPVADSLGGAAGAASQKDVLSNYRRRWQVGASLGGLLAAAGALAHIFGRVHIYLSRAAAVDPSR